VATPPWTPSAAAPTGEEGVPRVTGTTHLPRRRATGVQSRPQTSMPDQTPTSSSSHAANTRTEIQAPVVDAYRQLKSITEVANQLGISVVLTTSVLTEAGIETGWRYPRSTAPLRPKVTAAFCTDVFTDAARKGVEPSRRRATRRCSGPGVNRWPGLAMAECGPWSSGDNDLERGTGDGRGPSVCSGGWVEGSRPPGPRHRGGRPPRRTRPATYPQRVREGRAAPVSLESSRPSAGSGPEASSWPPCRRHSTPSPESRSRPRAQPKTDLQLGVFTQAVDLRGSGQTMG